MIRLFRKIMAQLAHIMALAASERRKIVARLCYDVRFGPHVRIDRGVMLVTRQGGRIRIGGNTHIWPGAIIDARGGVIEIGADSLSNAGSYIVAGERVTIGRAALIAEYVTIRDTDHAAHDPHAPMREQGRVTSPVTIAENVWLAAKVTVTKRLDNRLRRVSPTTKPILSSASIRSSSAEMKMSAGAPASI